MTDQYHVFLSYSRSDREAAVNLRAQLDRQGLSVFWDEKSIREGDPWLNRLQRELDACRAFIVLIGRDGVRGWVGAETEVALNRHYDQDNDAARLPIYPVLLGETKPADVPSFLRLFQATPWSGVDPLPQSLLGHIRERTMVESDETTFEGCPFVGLDAYRMDQAHLFFGRQKETLDALAWFDTQTGSQKIRWLEINGNSGSGKSSLMNAALLPLVDQGWLWRRTGYVTWRCIGPMMPGKGPVDMLAGQLARAFREDREEKADVRLRLEANDRGLADWLATRKDKDTAFLLAIDQFEELFTFAEPDERARFDRLLACALEDPDCPLFVISTVRADYLDRLGDVPRLVAVRNRLGKPWTMPPISADGLREVIAGPARLAGLDVTEVQEAMVAEARNEPGALPLVENALHWLWTQREDGRLSGRLFTDQGGLAGILSHGADGLLQGLGRQRDRALELLFRLINVDPEGRRHTRRRIPLAEAVAVAGQDLIDSLAGQRAQDGARRLGPLRLITVTEDPAGDDQEGGGGNGAYGSWVNLIHETLIRCKGSDDKGKPQPYWPTLWDYIEQHKHRAARRERLQLLAREWQASRGLGRLFGLAGWLELFRFGGIAVPGGIEQRYLRWSTASALVRVAVLVTIAGIAIESVVWTSSHDYPPNAVVKRWAYKLFNEGEFPKLIELPADSFMMGSERGSDYVKPVHRVTFTRPFYLGRTEVTFAQYDAFLEVTGRARPDDGQMGRDNRPVINVEWSDARAYTRWLSTMTDKSCRLPTEAEWEHACRAGTSTRFSFGDEISEKDANFEGYVRSTTEVGTYPANAWGLHDMHGNVSEWVEDCWHVTYHNAPSDGQAWLKKNDGDCTLRMVRDGSFVSSRLGLRCAARSRISPNKRGPFTGFRVVCSSPIFGD